MKNLKKLIFLVLVVSFLSACNLGGSNTRSSNVYSYDTPKISNPDVKKEMDRLVVMPMKARPLFAKARRFGIDTTELHRLVKIQPGVMLAVSNEAALCDTRFGWSRDACWMSVQDRMTPLYDLEGEIEAVADAIAIKRRAQLAGD